MSLILDALRRAEAERERGSVPGLHSHPAPSLADGDAPRSRIEPWHWMVIGVGIGIVVAAVWYVVGRFAAQQEAAVGGSAPTVASAPAVTSAPPVTAAPVPTAAPVASAPLSAPATTTPPSDAPVAEPAPWPQGERRSEPRTEPRNEVRSEPRSEQSKAPRKSDAGRAATGDVSSTPVPEAPLYTREQLPEGIRAQFPAMTFGGSMYSANAANRSLIINGQIHRENDLVAPDLSIEQIRVKGAVFRFKGYRVEVPY